MKFLVLTILSSLFFAASAYGETPLTQEDKEGLVGDYKFEGDFKNSRGLLIDLTISLDDQGSLIGHQRVKIGSEPRLTSLRYEFTNYRRLTASEWTSQWKVKTIPGDRCGRDRLCIVADLKYMYTWNNSMEITKYYKRLQQYSLDFQEVQNYTVEKMGFAGGLSAPYQKISGGKVTTVTNGTENQGATETDSSNTVSSLKAKLLELRSLVDEGLITEEDYVQAKKQILDGM
jgi:hypothetical protein